MPYVEEPTGGRGAGEGAEELSAWGDFAEVGEERLFK